MRIFLTILLIIVLLITILMLSRAVVFVEFWDGAFRWKLQYFGITILPRPKKSTDGAEETPKPSKKKKDAADKNNSQKDAKTEEETVTPKQFAADRFVQLLQKIAGYADMAGNALPAIPHTLQRICRGITWSDVETDILVANEDASKCATQYATVQMAIHLLLAEFGILMHVRRKRLAIACDFAADKSRWNVRLKVKLRLGSVVGAGLWFLFDYFRNSRKACKVAKKI